jgi:hypothetical protein
MAYIDLHCHPAMKPYGKSFTRTPQRINNSDRNQDNSIWFTDVNDELSEQQLLGLGIPKFTQSDFSSISSGQGTIVCVSLYPIEKKFMEFRSQIAQILIRFGHPINEILETIELLNDFLLGIEIAYANSPIDDILDGFGLFGHHHRNKIEGLIRERIRIKNTLTAIDNLLNDNIIQSLLEAIMEISRQRIEFVRNMPDYFTDLINEYQFYRQLDKVPFSLIRKNNQPQQFVQYQLINSVNELRSIDPNLTTIGVIITIEGGHVFDSGIFPLERPFNANRDVILNNVRAVKNWRNPPFFITLGHHFYNELCGHSKSFDGKMSVVLDQTYNLGIGITDLGWSVINELLFGTSPMPTQRKRIYIDIKHMSPFARLEYFRYLREKGVFNPTPLDDIPMIVSHGAVNGLRSFQCTVTDFPDTQNWNPFFEEGINFYDEELVWVKRSKGIFGLQLDKRRIASEVVIRAAYLNQNSDRQTGLNIAANLVFNQMRHIARVLDRAGESNVWDIIAIGTDFDGIISPMPFLETARDMPDFEIALQNRLKIYCKESRPGVKMGSLNFDELNPINRLNSDTIVRKVMRENAWSFFQRYLK